MKKLRVILALLMCCCVSGLFYEAYGDTLVAKAGQHPTFVRLIVPLPTRVEVNVATQGDTLTVKLLTQDKIDINRVNKTLKTPLPLSVEQRDGAQFLVLKGLPGIQTKHFFDKTTFVLDIIGQIPVQKDKEKKATTNPLTSQAPRPEEGSQAKELQTREDKESNPQTTQASVADSQKEEAHQKITTLKEVLEYLESNKHKPQEGDVKKRNEATKNKKAGSLEEVIVKIEIRQGKENLIFSTGREYPQVIFQRGDSTWMAIDTSKYPVEFIAAPALEDGPNLSAHQIDNIAFIRLQPSRALNLSRRTDETIYVISPPPLNPVHPQMVKVTATENAQPVVTVPIQGTQIVEWVDPEIGDKLTLIPTLQKGYGLDDRYMYVDAEILPTHQGVVLRKLTPEVMVTLQEKNVVLERPDGMRLSANSKDKNLPEPKENQSLFNFSLPESLKTMPLNDLNMHMQELALKAKPFERIQHHLTHAKALLLRNYFREARSLFGWVLKSNPLTEQEWELKAYYALASLLAEDRAEGSRCLRDPRLSRDPEMEFLLALAEAKYWNLERAKSSLGLAPGFLLYYPDNLRARLGLTALRTATHLKDYNLAGQLLELLQQTQIDSPRLREKIQYYQSLYLLSQKNEDQAEQLMRQFLESANPRLRAKANHYFIQKNWEKKLLTDKEALEKLEPLRLFWRHGVEYHDLVDFTVQLLLKTQQFSRALSVLRQALEKSPLAADQEHFAKKISETLVMIFTLPEVKSLPILTVLALFAEFKSFLNLTNDWPKVMVPLLDRLEKYDLLVPAIEIISERLAKHTYENEKERYQDIMRLAHLHIDNDQGDKALRLLSHIDIDFMDKTEREQLRSVQARALMLQQKFSEVLSLMADDRLSSLMARVMVYWQMSDWTHVSKTLGELLERLTPALTAESEIDVPKHELVLMQAIALNLAEEFGALGPLKEKYSHMMQSSPVHIEFQILLQGETLRNQATVHEIQDSINQLEVFKKFKQKKTVFEAQKSQMKQENKPVEIKEEENLETLKKALEEEKKMDKAALDKGKEKKGPQDKPTQQPKGAQKQPAEEQLLKSDEKQTSSSSPLDQARQPLTQAA